MTRDKLRIIVITEPVECEMCTKFEYVKHLMFECIVARTLWADVF
jgi:hypothetical protein